MPSWRAALPPSVGGRSLEAVAGTFSDQAAFEVSDGAEDVEDPFACGGGGIDSLLQGRQGDAALLEHFDGLEQLKSRPAKPVEPHDTTHVAVGA